MNGRFPLPLLVFAALLFLFRMLPRLDLDADFLEDLPFFLTIGAFLLFRVVLSQTGTKRRTPVPMPESQAEKEAKDLGFKLPPLKGAPKAAQSETQQAEDDVEILRQQSLQRHLAEKKAREEKMETERLLREHQKREAKTAEPETRQFSPGALRNAFIWSEIFAPPKALRKK